MNEYVYIDTETGGTCSATHSTIQVALGIRQAERAPLVFDAHVLEPDLRMDPRSVEYHRITPGYLHEHGVDPARCARGITDFIAKSGMNRPSLVGWNVGFDFEFLRRVFRLSGVEGWLDRFYRCFSHRLLDLQSALRFMGDQGFDAPAPGGGLREALAFFGVPLEEAHDARADMLATMRLHDVMTRAYGPGRPIGGHVGKIISSRAAIGRTTVELELPGNDAAVMASAVGHAAIITLEKT